MDTITTIPSLLKSNGSAQSVTVALMPNDIRLIAAALDLLEALHDLLETGFDVANTPSRQRARAAIAKATGVA